MIAGSALGSALLGWALLDWAPAAGVRLDIPVDPDAPHARDLLLNELSNPAYQAAKPTWLDIVSKAVGDWLGSLLSNTAGVGNPLAIVGIVVVVCLVVGAVIIFGLPRLNRRRRVSGGLVDVHDQRTAAELRRAAEDAAARGDFAAAIAEMYRAAATGLAERTIIALNPGTTAHEVAVRAGAAFPDHRAALGDGASLFDDVRYLGRAGDADGYARVSALEAALRASRPAALAALGPNRR
jgi:uncharacterized protein DUF4129